MGNGLVIIVSPETTNQQLNIQQLASIIQHVNHHQWGTNPAQTPLTPKFITSKFFNIQLVPSAKAVQLRTTRQHQETKPSNSANVPTTERTPTFHELLITQRSNDQIDSRRK